MGKVIYLTASHVYACAPQLVARAGRQSIFLKALELESMIFQIFKNLDFLNIMFVPNCLSFDIKLIFPRHLAHVGC